MFCRNCGSQIRDGVSFCTNCGMPLKDGNNSNIQTNDVAPQISNTGSNMVSVPVPKKSNAGLIVGIILGVLFLIGFIIIVAYFGISFIKTLGGGGHNPPISPPVVSKLKTEKVKDVSIEYDSSIWNKNTSKSDSESLFLEYDNYIVALRHSKSNTFMNTYSFANAMKDNFTSTGYTIEGYVTDKTVNGIVWKQLSFSKDNQKFTQLFYSTGYDLYSIAYSSYKDSFSLGESYFNDIVYTLKYDNTALINGEKEAKKVLVGEWDWGISGYFVFDNSGKVYLYKDSSKSMSNVAYGTYTADNKIATYASGYADGIYVVMTVDAFIIDGEKQSLSNNKIEYAFTKNNDGTYTIKNITTGSSNTAKKVK